MLNFSHSQYYLSSAFYEVKTFWICDQEITYLSSAQAKLLNNLFEWFQLGFYFYTFFVENARQGHSSHYGFYWLPLWRLLMENISFFCTINMDLCLHKTEFMERNPCHRRIQKSVWVQPKIFTCIITLISLLINWNTLNCSPSVGIKL